MIKIANDRKIIIDDCDEILFNSKSWRVVTVRGKSYLTWGFKKDGKNIVMKFHRVIMEAKKGQILDHINGDSLDNRRSNLRFVNSKQNAWNSVNKKNSRSRFKGVGWSHDIWVVNIRAGIKQIYVGRFKDEFEAAYNYDLASLKYHGDFGLRNFLPLVV